MNKFYLLPLSLIMLTPGFSEESENNLVPDEVNVIVAETPAPQAEESPVESLAIDPTVIKQLEEEISSMIDPEKKEEEVAAAVPEAVEEKAAEETPLSEKQPGSHVRRFATASAIEEAPVVQVEENQETAPVRPISKRAVVQNVPESKQIRPAQSRPQSKRSAIAQSKPVAKEGKIIADRSSPAENKTAQSKQVTPAKRPAVTAKPNGNSSSAQGKQPIQTKRKTLTKTPDVKVEAEKPKLENLRADAKAPRDEKLIAQAESAAPMSPSSQPKKPANKMMTNTAARPVVKKGTNLWVMGEALLWQATEENLTYVYTGNDLHDSHVRDLQTTDFDWDWGFKVGAGYNIPRDGWDIALYWTHIHNTASDHEKADGLKEVLYPVWNTAGTVFPGTINQAKGNWQVHLEQVDLDLGREFFVGKHLTTRPFVGARSAWIFQEYDIEYKGLNDDGGALEQEAALKNRYFGFGFVAGLNTDWRLGAGFSLYGDADVSILMGYFDVDQKGTQDDVKIWQQEKSFRTGRAIMDLGLGFKYRKLFSNDHFGLTFKAGYEYHLFFNQNQFILSSGNADFELFNPAKGDLTYQGVTGSVQFDF
jgi:hypothetical protein